jgi:hypothetical protein
VAVDLNELQIQIAQQAQEHETLLERSAFLERVLGAITQGIERKSDDDEP